MNISNDLTSQHITHANQHKISIISVKTLGICLGLIAIAFVAVTVYKVPAGTLLFAGALLLCPLMHLWMMKGGGHDH